MCTRSLAGNLSLWSIIQTLVDFSNKIQNGYVEQGMKHKSFEIYNLFKNIITFYKFSVTAISMLSIYDIINKTKHKRPLSNQEIHYIVDGYTNQTIPDYQVSAWLMAVCINGLTEEETFNLTKCMEYSGETLNWDMISRPTADKHSTGGVGDKTTLIVAPIVATCGVAMPKMSGRGLGHTGGTIDKLESIPNFNVNLTHQEYVQCIESVGCAVVSQSGNLTLADKKLYALRDVTATVDSIPLICSSIMSKKLAINSDCIVLDVKCGSGAFMKSLEDAKRLADLMVKVGRLSNKKCKALITNMNVPLGYYVGNALEVIEAIEVLKGNSKGQLYTLSIELASEVLANTLNVELDKARELAINSISSGDALQKFVEMVTFQGGNADVVSDYSIFGTPKYSYVVKANGSGYIHTIDCEEVGRVSLLLGAGRKKKSDSIDYLAGIKFNYHVGDIVSKGDALATLYSNTVTDYSEISNRLLNAISIDSVQPVPCEVVYSRV